MGGCTPNNTNLLLFMSLVTRRSLSWVQVLSPSYTFHPKIRSLWISDDTLDSTLAKVRFTLDINNWGDRHLSLPFFRFCIQVLSHGVDGPIANGWLLLGALDHNSAHCHSTLVDLSSPPPPPHRYPHDTQERLVYYFF
jgi:hypothetical protein